MTIIRCVPLRYEYCHIYACNSAFTFSILCFLPLRQAVSWPTEMKVRTYRLILTLNLHKDLRYIHAYVLVIEISNYHFCPTPCINSFNLAKFSLRSISMCLILPVLSIFFQFRCLPFVLFTCCIFYTLLTSFAPTSEQSTTRRPLYMPIMVIRLL